MAPRTRRSSGMVRKQSARQGIPKDILVQLSPRHGKECMFCGRKDISEKLYGLLYQLNDVVVHYFCILLSSMAVQNGADKEGLWGFLLKDIKAEIDRGSRETCYYCKRTGATISCCGPKCRRTFHLPCGLQNGSMHQYYQSFRSFCQLHRMTQTVDIKYLQNSDPVDCAICKEPVKPCPTPSSLWAPCCKRNAWFHRVCIQELALSSGYFFKCPLCNNLETFKSRMLYLGIYIPSRDASWETVPNAFAELLERHSTCNVEVCLCPHPDKRTFQQETGSWEIILCHTCGSNGTHLLCSSLKCNEVWYCSTCHDVAEGSTSVKRRRLEITNDVSSNDTNSNGVYSNGASSSSGSPISTNQEENPPSQHRNLRSSNGRVVLRNVRTRESARLNRQIIRNESTSQQKEDIILISDESDSSDADSDVQFITYLGDSTYSPLNISRLPVISNVTSMCAGVPRLGVNSIPSPSVNTSVTIDLTLDEEQELS